jgi:tyrosine-protein kinase Etk/Wzc
MTESNQSEGSHEAASTDNDISLLDLLQVVVENLRLLVLAPLTLGLLALAIAFAIAPTFTATTRFMPPQQQQSSASIMLQNLGALGGLAGAAAGLKNPIDQYVALLKSESIANVLIDRFQLVKRYESDFKSDARKELESSSKIIGGKDGLISIDVDDKDPVIAAQMANAYVEELGKLLNRLSLTEAQQRRAFFEIQLTKTKDNLVTAELALNSSGVNASAMKSNPEVAVRAVAELQAQIAAQEIKLVTMRGYLAPSAPDFKLAQAELSALRAQLSKSERSSTPVSRADADYVARYRDFKYYETLFELFARQFELAKVDEAREGAIIQVIDIATPPERKSKPKKALIAVMTTVGSGMLLLIFVFVRQALRNARNDPASASKMQQLDLAVGQALRKQ